MESIVGAVKDTPIPTLLILAGLFFVLLGFVDKLGGVIEVSQSQKKWTIPIGLFILTIGLAIYLTSFDPNVSNPQVNLDQSVIAKPDEKQQVEVRDGELPAVINDPHGHTNVRAGQNINSAIKFKIYEDDVFYTIPQTENDWWPVRRKDNKSGYMHKSRITINNNN